MCIYLSRNTPPRPIDERGRSHFPWTETRGAPVSAQSSGAVCACGNISGVLLCIGGHA